MACEGDGKKVKDVKVEPSYIIYIYLHRICMDLCQSVFQLYTAIISVNDVT